MVYNVVLKKVKEVSYLVFKIDENEFMINLNSSDQSNLKDLFYKIINKLFIEKVEFKLEQEDGYNEVLYIDIAKDYIKKLNDEIENVYNNMPEEFKKKL